LKSLSGNLENLCYVLTGKARERVVAAAVDAFNANPEGLTPEYPFFPDPLHEPHLRTFTKFRGQLGDAQGVERADKAGRRRDTLRFAVLHPMHYPVSYGFD
jgi:hypothetical protein